MRYEIQIEGDPSFLNKKNTYRYRYRAFFVSPTTVCSSTCAGRVSPDVEPDLVSRGREA